MRKKLLAPSIGTIFALCLLLSPSLKGAEPEAAAAHEDAGATKGTAKKAKKQAKFDKALKKTGGDKAAARKRIAEKKAQKSSAEGVHELIETKKAKLAGASLSAEERARKEAKIKKLEAKEEALAKAGKIKKIDTKGKSKKQLKKEVKKAKGKLQKKGKRAAKKAKKKARKKAIKGGKFPGSEVLKLAKYNKKDPTTAVAAVRRLTDFVPSLGGSKDAGNIRAFYSQLAHFKGRVGKPGYDTKEYGLAVQALLDAVIAHNPPLDLHKDPKRNKINNANRRLTVKRWRGQIGKSMPKLKKGKPKKSKTEKAKKVDADLKAKVAKKAAKIASGKYSKDQLAAKQARLDAIKHEQEELEKAIATGKDIKKATKSAKDVAKKKPKAPKGAPAAAPLSPPAASVGDTKAPAASAAPRAKIPAAAKAAAKMKAGRQAKGSKAPRPVPAAPVAVAVEG
jgi:hypothetical protein